MPFDDSVLSRVRDALAALYGDNIDRIVLYGSRARGDAREDSDYDVAVFLKALADKPAERRRLGELRHAVLEDTRRHLGIRAFAAGTYDDWTALMGEIRSDGRAL